MNASYTKIKGIMKQLIFSLLALTALAGCSQSENGIDKDTPVAIQLTSGIGVITRATVTNGAIGAGDDVTAQIEFWETTTTPTYTDASTWKSDAKVTDGANAQAITLNPLVYYNADDAVKSFIKGWYPKIASNDGTVTIPNTDGTVDVLLSNAVSGSKKTNVSNALVFNHQTAQLIFKVLKGEGLLDGTKIKSITVKGAKVPTSIALATDVVTYTPVTDLAVPSLTIAEIKATDDATAIAGLPVMIEPVGDNTTLTLDIETVKADGTTVAATYTGVKFTTDAGKLEKGKAYTITLTFKQNNVELTAKITPWANASGQGDVI